MTPTPAPGPAPTSAPTSTSPADVPGEPLDLLVEHSFVTRGDALVAHRVAALVQAGGGWVPGVLALTVRAVREGSAALALRDLAMTPAEVEHGHEDDVDVEATLMADVLTVPGPQELTDLITADPLVREGVLHVEYGLVYLDRYFRDEVLIADLIEQRDAAVPTITPDRAAAAAALAGTTLDIKQRQAVDSVLDRGLTVLTGGPGMGKTYTLAAVLRAARAAFGASVRIGLAAPTGRAAARMTESLRDAGLDADTVPDAVTLHRLLGPDPRNSQRFRHNRTNPLPHDLVVVDEASMLSLSLMARLMEALRPTARLLLVGDPDQLASVEAGSVLSDLVSGLDGGHLVELTTHHRLGGARQELARAFSAPDDDARVAGVLGVLQRDGDSAGTTEDADAPVHPTTADPVTKDATAPNDDVEFLATDDVLLDDIPHVVESAWALRQAAASGDVRRAIAALRRHRLLCAHRTGPYGVARWNRLIETALAERGADVLPGRMYVGRPLIITKNDPSLGLFNGDSGVVIDLDGRMVVLMDRGQQVSDDPTGEASVSSGPDAPNETKRPTPVPDRSEAPDAGGGHLHEGPDPAAHRERTQFSPWRLGDVETMHAMTVHKAQGSQAEHVTVIVPPLGSRLLTREMLYTAVTRASERLTVVGSPDAVEHAARTPARRASGLAHRLGGAAPRDVDAPVRTS